MAGCGTSQAAKYALRQPASQVVGIDVSATSVRHTEELKRKYNLANLEVHQLPIEQVGDVGAAVSTGWCAQACCTICPIRRQGLRALREVLAPDGALNLMVYAAYGRAGVYMLQEYCRMLGIGHSDEEIQELANTLTAMSPAHPLAPLLGESPDFRSRAGLADALLNPQDRAYTVPQLFDLIDQCGLRFMPLDQAGALSAPMRKPGCHAARFPAGTAAANASSMLPSSCFAAICCGIA